MKRSKKVTLVLITAAMASCNRYLSPSNLPSVYSTTPDGCDSCAAEMVYADPVYDPWYGSLLTQWIYAFNPYAYNFYYYGSPGRSRITRYQGGHRLSRSSRTTVVRGGWGRSAHTSVNS